MKKNICTIGLALVLIISFSLIAIADEIVPYASESIRDTGIALSVSGGKVYAAASVSATSIASKLGFSSIKLYHKVDGVWKVAASTKDAYGANSKSYSSSVSCALVPGREYKASCSSMATVNGISDTGSASVGPVTYY